MLEWVKASVGEEEGCKLHCEQYSIIYLCLPTVQTSFYFCLFNININIFNTPCEGKTNFVKNKNYIMAMTKTHLKSNRDDYGCGKGV